MNADGCPGLCLVDDDLDGSIDEGSASDDDEDGGEFEDWLDPVVFHLVGNTLVERTPVPWDTTGNAAVDGRDFVQSTIATNVTHFRVERFPALGNGPVLLELTLALTNGSTQETFSLSTRVRVGAAIVGDAP